ncbi:MAG: glycosyltransferase family 87 protein, partial [Sphingomonas sp.]
RPFVAGLLIGCLVYKPQFAVLLPLVLLAGGHWRGLAGAALSASVLCLSTLAIWGAEVWVAFLRSLPLTRAVVIEQGSTGWEKIASAFSCVRMWGGSLPLAYAVQTAATGIALAGAIWATRRAAPAVRDAAVMAAALLSTPYVLDYDFVMLGVAIAFIVADARARGWLRWEASLLAFAYAAPLFARAATAMTGVPVALIAAAAVFTLALRRAAVVDGAWPLRSSPSRRSRAAFAP